MATAEKAVEIADVVEDVQELVEAKASWITSNPKFLAIGASLLGVASGAALGYVIASKHLEKKWQSFADEQIASVKAHYSVIRKDGKSLSELAAAYPDEEKEQDKAVADEIIQEEGYTSYDKVEPTADPPESPLEEEITVTQAIVEATSRRVVERNVFESDNPDTYFDFTEEMKRREEKPDEPYVITKEEFDNNESDFDQATLTYYDGDDVLADDKDSPIPEVDKVMGYENLLRFGHGSGDPEIVYIRNTKLQLDFEVTHSDGKFAKEVLGFDDELQHSDRRIRKFRASDE